MVTVSTRRGIGGARAAGTSRGSRLVAALAVAALLAGCAGSPAAPPSASPAGAPEAAASAGATRTHEAPTHEPAATAEATHRAPTPPPAPSASTASPSPAATKRPGLIGGAAAPPASITAFGLVGPTEKAVIDQAAHTISLTVDVCWAGQVRNSGIAATFATNGSSVTVGGVAQASGVTANTFKPSQVYTVTAADGTTQAYTVTVDVFIAMLGMDYGGGKIAYILQSGDPGYEACHQHGIIAATSDAGGKTRWAGDPYGVPVSPQPSGLRTGGTGTTMLVRAMDMMGVDRSAYAGGLARSYGAGGYTDWSLPSQVDLSTIYYSQPFFGGMAADWYWSSTGYSFSMAPVGTTMSEYTNYVAWQFNNGPSVWAEPHGTGLSVPDNGNHNARVRPVRYF